MTFLDVDQLPGLVDDLGNVGDRLGELAPVNAAAAAVLLTQAKAQTPRRTGALAADQSTTATVTAGTLTSRLPYAIPVFFGWARGRAVVAGRPWVLDAAAVVEADLIDVYATHVDTCVGKVG